MANYAANQSLSGDISVKRDKEASALAMWFLCWIVLPNLPFLPITIMGGPPRYSEIIVCGLVGLLARRYTYWVRVLFFLGLMAYLLVTYIAHMFNMAPQMILQVAPLVFDLKPTASIEYLLGASLFAVVIGLALWLLSRPHNFTLPKWAILAFAITLVLATADYAHSRGTMGAYTRIAPDGTPFTSAVKQSHFLTLADGKRNVMLVIVESMGQPRDPALRAELEKIWMRPELRDRFEMSHGTTAFFGSTTNGEMRELCGRWGNYFAITHKDPSCLPAKLAAKGYRTTSYHAFTSSFFQRGAWYPLIGIQHSEFGTTLERRGAETCANVFVGACDRDIPKLIGQDLARAKQPQFVYWLTLNSHLPVIESKQLGTEKCGELGPKLDWKFPMICRLFALWDQTAQALAKEVNKPDFPPTDILIVGDHMPPFTRQASRLQFESTDIPWILLRDRRTQSSKPSVSPPAT